MKKKKKKAQKDWVEKKDEFSKPKDANCLRSKDVAHVLDCSPDDVIELARKGHLPAYKVGRFWRFKEKEVLKYKKKQEA